MRRRRVSEMRANVYRTQRFYSCNRQAILCGAAWPYRSNAAGAHNRPASRKDCADAVFAWRLLLSRWQRPRCGVWKMGLRNSPRVRFLVLQQFALCNADVPDHELAGKYPAFFHRNGPRRNIAFQCTPFMNGHHCFGNDLSRHPPFDFNAARTNSAEAMNVGLAVNDDVSRADTAGNIPAVVDRCSVVAMQISAQPAFDQRGSANHAAAPQIAPAGQMHVAACSNASAETACDFVVTQINMRAARRADCRGRPATDLLFPFTFKALDNRTALPLPKILEPAKNGRTLWRGSFFYCP